MLAGVAREDATRSCVAVDAVFDSVSVATTFQEELAKAGVLFMPISEALQKKTHHTARLPCMMRLVVFLPRWIILGCFGR